MCVLKSWSNAFNALRLWLLVDCYVGNCVNFIFIRITENNLICSDWNESRDNVVNEKCIKLGAKMKAHNGVCGMAWHSWLTGWLSISYCQWICCNQFSTSRFLYLFIHALQFQNGWPPPSFVLYYFIFFIFSALFPRDFNIWHLQAC